MQSTTPPSITNENLQPKVNFSPTVLLYKYDQESEQEYKPDNINIIINQKDKNKPEYVIYGIFHVILTFVAVYLSWKCNNGELDIFSFLISLIFPYVYIIYILATKGTCDIK